MKNIPLTKKERTAIIAGIGLLIIGFFSYLTFAGTNIGISLKTSGGLGNSLSTGLVAYWTFDGTNMTSNVADSSGKSNNGYLTGFTSTTTVYGKIGQALKFNGSSNEVDIPYNASLDLPDSGGAISAWFYDAKSELQNSENSIYWRLPHSNPAVEGGVRLGVYNFNSSTGNRLSASIGASAVDHAADRYFGGTDIAVNTWHHGVFTWTSTTIALYLDGVQQSLFQVGTGSATSSTRYVPLLWPNAIGPRIGFGKSNALFTGNIDDVRVYNRTLSAAEVARLYREGGGATVGASVQTNSNTGNSLSTGLVGYWTFDGNKMTSNAGDSSGQGNNGFLVGYTSTTTTYGKIGQALAFNGTAQRVTVPNNSALDTTTLTISAWVRTNNRTSCLSVAGMDGGGGILLNLNSTGVGCTVADGSIAFWNGGAWVNAALGVGMVGDGQWHMVTGVTNGSNSFIYWDGIQKGNAAATAVAATNPFYIGYESIHNTYFNGTLDEVRFYNRALTAAEVTRLYQDGGGATAGASVQTNSNTGNSLSTGLIGYWTFDGKNMKSNVTDSSGSGNTGYLGGYTSTTTIYGKVGQALDFNGSTNYVSTTAGLVTGTTTLTAWVKLRGTCDDFDQIVGASIDGLLTHSNGGCELRYNWTNWSATFNFSSGLQIPRNQWVFVGVTITGANTTLYLGNNGILSSAVNTVTNQAENFNNINIGRNNGGANYVTGGIDDVRFYNRALSTSEMQRLYQLGK